VSTAPAGVPAGGLAGKGAALASAAARGTAWLRRRLRDPDRPLIAVEVRTRSVGVVRMTRDGERAVLGAAAFLELPEGCVKLSMTQPNIVDADTFKQTLRAVLERAGVLEGGRVALVLPDPVARVALVPAAEVKGNRSQVDELVRFRLRKAVPFDVREAHVATVAGGARSGDPLMVGAIYRPVLEGYEAACRAVGLHPGLVELSGLALLSAAFAPRPTADRLLVNWDDGYVSLVLARGEWPILVRTLTSEAASSPDDIAREAGNTVLYYRERLGGAGLAEAVVRSAALPPSEAVAWLEKPLELVPEVVDPGAWLGGGTPMAMSQAIAGAAASLVGSTT
jgi:Tfp pilus assembly PilM family ATPase